jgi:flagellin
MSINSIQTNVNSLLAQENLRVNNEFQSRTIQRLTSGYRINSSGDDAAGLAVANKYRSDIAELSQGVRNANDGISAMQIVDGGLNNISKILDRLKTLATQSASGTFTGNRTTLNSEYQALLLEMDRQANNIGLVSGGRYNTALTVYIGGGSTHSNSQVSIDLSGTANRVDSSSLALQGTNVAAGGFKLTGNLVDTLDTGTDFLSGSNTQVFTFRIFNTATSAAANVTVTVSGDADGLNGAEVVTQLNSGLSQYGITAGIDTDGFLTFSGARAFSVQAAAASGGAATATAASGAENQGNYRVAGSQFTAFATMAAATSSEIVTFENASGAVNVSFGASITTVADAIAAINAKTAAMGIYAVSDAAGTGISIQGAQDFTVTKIQAADVAGVFTAALGTKTVSDPSAAASTVGNAQSALTALGSAVSALGAVQGKVGTGQNKLQYAIQLAQSQIASFSAAEMRIRDADVAFEAANLTKAQVLQQASLAAMAQANAAPQAILALLRG